MSEEATTVETPVETPVEANIQETPSAPEESGGLDFLDDISNQVDEARNTLLEEPTPEPEIEPEPKTDPEPEAASEDLQEDPQQPRKKSLI